MLPESDCRRRLVIGDGWPSVGVHVISKSVLLHSTFSERMVVQLEDCLFKNPRCTN